MPSISLIEIVAPYLVPYLEIHALAGDLYYFRKESTALLNPDGTKRVWHPRLKHTMLRPYHSKTEGILYAAFRKGVWLHEIRPEDLLYIGCSATGGARYWRGRPTPNGKFSESKSCFHHEQMRRGRDGSNLENYLSQVGPVVIHTLTDVDALKIAQNHKVALPDGKYPAHKLERAILAEGFRKWKWNRRS